MTLAYRGEERRELAPIPPHLEERLAKALAPGERVLWRGRPGTWSAIAHEGRGLIGPVLLLVATFLLMVLAIVSNGGVFFVFFAGPGLATIMLFSRRLGRTVYAVTPRRALVIVDDAVTSLGPAALGDLRREGGDLVLARRPAAGFWGIADAAAVERIIRDEMTG